MANPEGRRHVLDAAGIAAMAELVSNGIPKTLCHTAAGIARSTFFRYQAAGEAFYARLQEDPGAKPESEFEQLAKDLLDAMEKARATKIEANLQKIRQAATVPNHWTAAAWILERTEPDHFRRRETTELTGPGGGAIPLQVLDGIRKDGAKADEAIDDALGGDPPAES